jgi:hypothetical protein
VRTQFVMYAFTCCAIERWSATEMRARKSSSLRARGPRAGPAEPAGR